MTVTPREQAFALAHVLRKHANMDHTISGAGNGALAGAAGGLGMGALVGAPIGALANGITDKTRARTMLTKLLYGGVQGAGAGGLLGAGIGGLAGGASGGYVGNKVGPLIDYKELLTDRNGLPPM